jgi:hypothetical protein
MVDEQRNQYTVCYMIGLAKKSVMIGTKKR